MKQTARIRRMEQSLRRASRAVKNLSEALDIYEKALPDFAALNDYYGSDDWKQDFLDDESGRLPQGLKRGVLSEDGIWNVLETLGELRERAKRL